MANALIQDRLVSLQNTIGKSAVNGLFPNDIELYFFALELVNSLTGDAKEYFVFPVNPSDIKESKTNLVNIKKTAGGVTTISTQTFVPTDITINGNFGRNFKFLVNSQVISFSAFSFISGAINNGANINIQEFSPTIKSGYGCCKILERIVNKASTLDKDNNSPYTLYLYNLALGNNYIVKPINLTFSQNQGSNMIWNYSLTLKSLSRIEDLMSESQNTLSATTSANAVIQKAGNIALQGAKNILRR